MSLAVKQKVSTSGFVKPGELIDLRAGTALSLQDRRIFNLLIENAWSEIGEDKEHRIALSQLRGEKHRGSQRVGDSVEALMTTTVRLPTMLDGQAAIYATQLLGETTKVIDEDSPHAVLRYTFPKGLRRIIQDSRYWGRIKAYVMFHFTSKYALALYEALCLRANLRNSEQEFTMEELRELLGVEDGKYPMFPQLKQRVLDQAVFEVNALSDFTVSLDVERSGGTQRGKVRGLVVRWEKKSPDEWRATLDELMRPKVGRLARLRGTTEEAGTSDQPPARQTPRQRSSPKAATA